MKHILCIVLAAALLLCACSQYAEPSIDILMTDILASQQFEADMTEASDDEIAFIFGIESETATECAACYSGKGGLADMVAIFKVKDSSDTSGVEQTLNDYKSARYDDFKGYAPMEAKKIKDGKVYVYGKYVVFVVVPDISSAESVLDLSFKT